MDYGFVKTSKFFLPTPSFFMERVQKAVDPEEWVSKTLEVGHFRWYGEPSPISRTYFNEGRGLLGEID
jgi:hypothetical protein